MNKIAQALLVLFVFNSSLLAVTPEDDTLYNSAQWWINDSSLNVDVLDAWVSGWTGNGVGIAIFDTGISQHVDLLDNLSSATGVSKDGPDAGNDHATQVAGYAAAVDNNIGIVGIAPGATLYDFDIGGGDSLTPEVANYYVGSGVAAGGAYTSDALTDVRNHSYGYSVAYYVDDDLKDVRTAMMETAENNVIDVAAAGNSRSASVGDPAVTAFGLSGGDYMQNTPFVITVGATNQSDTFTDFSSFGANLMVSAPGENVTSTNLTNAYATSAGTSFSSPIVAGAIALAKEAVPEADVWMIKHALARSSKVIDATDSSDVGGWITNAAGFQFNNNYGFGKLQAQELVTATQKIAYIENTALVTTGDVDPGQALGAAAVSQTVNVNAPTADKVTTVMVTIGFDLAADLNGAVATLKSPSGTVHTFLVGVDGNNIDYDGFQFIPGEDYVLDFTEYTFAVNGFWGEDMNGNWEVSITSPEDTVNWSKLRLDIYNSDYHDETAGPITFSANTDVQSLQLDYAASSVTVDPGVTLSSQHHVHLNGGSFTNNGTVQSNGFKDIMLVMNSVNGAPSFSNTNTATFDAGISNTGGSITNSGTLSTTGNVLIAGGGSLNSSGTFNAANLSLSSASMTNTNAATVTGTTLVSNSTLSNSGAGVFVTDILQVSAGMVTNDNTMNTTTTTLSDGSVTTNDTFTATTVNVNGGTFTNTNTANSTNTSVNGGSLNNSGNYTDATSTSLSDGSITNSGTYNTVTTTVSGGALSNSGTFNTTTTSVTGGSLSNSGTYNTTTTAVSDATLTNSSAFNSTTSVTLANSVVTNTGTITTPSLTLDGGEVINGGGTITNLDTVVVNSGTLNNLEGAMNFNGGSTMDVNAGTLLDSANTITGLGTLTVGSAGTVTHTNSGAVASKLADTVNNAGTLNVTVVNPAASFTADDLTNTGTFNFSGAQLTVTNALTSPGTLAILGSGTTITANTISLAGGTVSTPLVGTPTIMNATAAIPLGDTLHISGISGVTPQSGQSYTLFTAAGGASFSGNFSTLTWSTASVTNLLYEYTLDALAAGGGSVTVSYSRNFLNSQILPAYTQNQLSVATSLASIDTTTSAGSEEQLALAAFDELSGSSEVTAALDQLMPIEPETFQILARSAVRGQTSKLVLQNRSHWMRKKMINQFIEDYGFSPVDEYDQLAADLLDQKKAVKYDPLADSYYVVKNEQKLSVPYSRNYRLGFSVSGSYDRGTFGSSTNTREYDFRNYSLMTRLSLTIGEHMMAGLMLGGDRGDAELGNGSTVEMDSLSLGSFLSGAFSRFYADAIMSYSFLRYDSMRRVNFGSLNEGFNSDPEGRMWSAYLGGGMDIPLGSSFNFGPTFSAQYINWEMDGYTEGGAHPFALSNGSVEADSLWLDVGARMSYFHAWESVDLLANLQATVSKDMMEDSLGVTSTFHNANGALPMTNTSLENDTYLISIGTGVDLTIHTNTSLSLECGYTLGDDFNVFSVEAALGYRL